MRLSERTLTILKNFSTINTGIVLSPGTFQRTLESTDAILAEATLDDDFPSKFAIYDLPKFLGNVTSMENPDLEFLEDGTKVIISDQTVSVTYRGSNEGLIVAPGNKSLTLPDEVIEFSLSQDSLVKFSRLGGMNALTTLTFEGKDGTILAKVHDETDASNEIVTNLGQTSSEFEMSFKLEYMKMIPMDYTVAVVPEKFAKFTSVDGKLTYWIARKTPKKR